MNSQMVVVGQPGKCLYLAKQYFSGNDESPMVTMVTRYFQSSLQLQRLPRLWKHWFYSFHSQNAFTFENISLLQNFTGFLAKRIS